jgi:chemotaxis protein CheD
MQLEQNRLDRDDFNVIHVVQGDYHVSNRADTVLTTILGSCVATCLSDPVAGVGGMNHFVLPHGDSSDGTRNRYGLHAMELLINGLLKMGARKDRIEAKLFGGAMMHDGLGRIGVANGEFAVRFLDAEGIRCVAKSLGGTDCRRIRYVPSTGQARQMIVQSSELVVAPAPPRKRQQSSDDVTFF